MFSPHPDHNPVQVRTFLLAPHTEEEPGTERAGMGPGNKAELGPEPETWPGSPRPPAPAHRVPSRSGEPSDQPAKGRGPRRLFRQLQTPRDRIQTLSRLQAQN